VHQVGFHYRAVSRCTAKKHKIPAMSSRHARGYLNHFVRTPKISYVCPAQFLPQQIPIIHITRLQQDGALLAAVSIKLSVLST